MPKILRFSGGRGLVATIGAMSMVVAACGSTEAAETEPQEVVEAQESGGTVEEAAGEGTGEAVEDSSEGAAEESSEEVVNLFPDVDVVNVVDGTTVNVADQLGGGDLPVLLWFWAPH